MRFNGMMETTKVQGNNVAEMKVSTQGSMALGSFFKKLSGVSPEACSKNVEVINAAPFHCLMSAVEYAFDHHHNLWITPDVMWITLTQGLANHINMNAEDLRSKFVSHEGKLLIRVRDDSLVKGSPDNDWEKDFALFSAEIKKHIGEQTHSLIVADFSTTGNVEKAASEIVLMDAMKAYFEYRVCTMCGIPNIYICGTLGDWEKMKEKVAQWEQYGLGWWTKSVLEILDEFIEAKKGNANSAFWSRAYNKENQSGGPYIKGWMVNLFPYLENQYNDGDPFTRNPYIDVITADLFGGLTSDRLPSSVSKVPFIWEYLGTEYKYDFYAGLLGVSSRDSVSVEPEIGWAVAPSQE